MGIKRRRGAPPHGPASRTPAAHAAWGPVTAGAALGPPTDRRPHRIQANSPHRGHAAAYEDAVAPSTSYSEP